MPVRSIKTSLPTQGLTKSSQGNRPSHYILHQPQKFQVWRNFLKIPDILNGISVCENAKNLERPYPDHYWRQTSGSIPRPLIGYVVAELRMSPVCIYPKYNRYQIYKCYCVASYTVSVSVSWITSNNTVEIEFNKYQDYRLCVCT
jgi:hypothetical protein